ncbi:hypothetical protein HMI01_02480 [Halolactibacillus miurensis]|uniref:Uncharacterized protein n=1 Tax=Halolactibacillus miurensis TaxID=306541 RepID=A0A1I6Q608_9BACI|nr:MULTISPECIES: hypothetical protein [Halolactibacillus]GEM03260.1 hypothetical protein HMI01_02480 [Halolactibacillus miurensis]SFS47901.1 hypothetical protein SAMN05421668_103126 [Halolactibacillus miurensis]
MRQGLFVLFLMLILAFFVIGYQSEQHQESHEDSSVIVSTGTITVSPYV